MRYPADIRTFVFVGIYFLLAYSGFIFFDRLPVPVIIAMCILTCFFAFFCAVIVHNTIHSPVFTKKSWNKAFQYVLSVAYGYSVSSFVPGHNLSHHRETQTPKDTMRTSKATFRWNFLNQLLFFFIVSLDVSKAEFKWTNRMRKERPKWFYQYLSESILITSLKVALLIINWKAALVFIIIPHLYGVWGVVGTNLWQHDGCDPDHPYNHSRTFTGRFVNYFAFNNGYHTAHHMKPGLHWSLLPAYHEKEIAPHLHPNLNRRSLLAYLWESCIYPGKRVDYLGNPQPKPDPGKDEDWVADVNWSSGKHAQDLGAESVAA